MPSLRLSCCILLIVFCARLDSGLELRAQAKRPMTLVDLLNIPRVLDPQITHDGRLVTFTLLTTDWPSNRRMPQIWQIKPDGTALRRLTSLETGASNARWSPDGSTIAFLARGKEPGQSIFLMSADGGTPRQLSHHATSVADIAWHPDGTSIYFLANDLPTDAQRERERARGDIQVLDEFRQRHLWKIALADAKETRVTTGDYAVFAFRIATDGQKIVMSRRPTPLAADVDKIELWIIRADGTGAVQLTHNGIPEEDGDLAPDGSQVLFVARANDRQEPYYNANLFLMPAAGGTPRALMPKFPYEVLRAAWAADGKSIWMVVNMGVHSELFQVDLASRTPRQITDGAHAIEQWTVGGDRHVFLVDEPARIGDVWTLAPRATAPTRVTGVYDYLDRDFALPRQERVEWKGADGVRVEGILTYPVDYKPGTRYPLVVQMHGGPEASDRFGFGTLFLNYHPAWAARGYAILRPNYRGSSGYGNAFYREPVGGYFKNSHLDVLAGVDRVIAMGVADPDRLTMMGWSAGGHLVNKLITFTNRFKAASSYAGVANWISLYGQSDTRGDRDLWMGGSIWQKNAPIQTYWDHSPLKYISAARTPTIFLIGEDDPRIPMAQSIEMNRALRAQGVPSELHVAPGEGHTWSQPRHQLYKMNAEIEWFERYARQLPYTPEAVPAENNTKIVPAP
jgi:dipeptidyl aminopeptidase/acylaminoacyl peptidase